MQDECYFEGVYVGKMLFSISLPEELPCQVCSAYHDPYSVSLTSVSPLCPNKNRRRQQNSEVNVNVKLIFWSIELSKFLKHWYDLSKHQYFCIVEGFNLNPAFNSWTVDLVLPYRERGGKDGTHCLVEMCSSAIRWNMLCGRPFPSISPWL